LWTQQAKLVPADSSVGQYFGYHVAVDGDTAVVGAYGDDSTTGSAYVFTRQGNVWSQQAKLLAADGAGNDGFGWYVSVDGDTALIGGPGDDDNGNVSGAAYVFVRLGSVWTQQSKLLPDDGAATDFFGQSVAIKGDTAVIGATFDDDNGPNSGSAYVFVRQGSAWTQQTKLLPADGEGSDYFGESVAIDGDTIVVGTDRDDSAYVFTRVGGMWTETIKLLPADGDAPEFGAAVAVAGDTVLVGAFFDDGDGGTDHAGSAYVFRLTCGNGVDDPGEECDDGNNVDGDGCQSNCLLPACGDGSVDAGEECDDGGETATCDDDCTLPFCGDGNQNEAADEECDDGNNVDGDGCEANCLLPCGDGTVDPGEECDDGGETATCDDDCTFPLCGDGNPNTAAGEECDDGGATAACDDDCTYPLCGDGNLNTAAGEECDDGNNMSGDGCSPDCFTEVAVPATSPAGVVLLLLALGGAATFALRRRG